MKVYFLLLKCLMETVGALLPLVIQPPRLSEILASQHVIFDVPAAGKERKRGLEGIPALTYMGQERCSLYLLTFHCDKNPISGFRVGGKRSHHLIPKSHCFTSSLIDILFYWWISLVFYPTAFIWFFSAKRILILFQQKCAPLQSSYLLILIGLEVDMWLSFGE